MKNTQTKFKYLKIELIRLRKEASASNLYELTDELVNKIKARIHLFFHISYIKEMIISKTEKCLRKKKVKSMSAAYVSLSLANNIFC